MLYTSRPSFSVCALCGACGAHIVLAYLCAIITLFTAPTLTLSLAPGSATIYVNLMPSKDELLTPIVDRVMFIQRWHGSENPTEISSFSFGWGAWAQHAQFVAEPLNTSVILQ